MIILFIDLDLIFISFNPRPLTPHSNDRFGRYKWQDGTLAGE